MQVKSAETDKIFLLRIPAAVRKTASLCYGLFDPLHHKSTIRKYVPFKQLYRKTMIC